MFNVVTFTDVSLLNGLLSRLKRLHVQLISPPPTHAIKPRNKLFNCFKWTHLAINKIISDLILIVCVQAKKRQYDQEVENLEKKQKQTIERLEQDHTSRLRDEAKRIKSDQDKELSKFQNMLKNRKKEV